MTVPASASRDRDVSAAYARGVQDVLALARQTADALETRTARPLVVGFAVEALRALADEAEASLLNRSTQP